MDLSRRTMRDRKSASPPLAMGPTRRDFTAKLTALKANHTLLFESCCKILLLEFMHICNSYESENDNPATNFQLSSVTTSGEMIARQADFDDVSSQDVSTCPVSRCIDQGEAVQEASLRDNKSPDVSVNAPRLDLIPEFNLKDSNDLMRDARRLKPSDLNLRLLETQKMSFNQTRPTTTSCSYDMSEDTRSLNMEGFCFGLLSLGLDNYHLIAFVLGSRVLH
ncbi:unnamed protein product [Sphagnum tenellum]